LEVEDSIEANYFDDFNYNECSILI
jgi:hypothetical protein